MNRFDFGFDNSQARPRYAELSITGNRTRLEPDAFLSVQLISNDAFNI